MEHHARPPQKSCTVSSAAPLSPTMDGKGDTQDKPKGSMDRSEIQISVGETRSLGWFGEGAGLKTFIFLPELNFVMG